MSIFFRVYSSTADTSVNPTGQATYAAARALTSATTATATQATIGQHFVTTYACRQVFLQFDTTTAPTTGTAQIVLKCELGSSSGDTLEASEVSSSANKIAGASLSSLTQIGSVLFPASFGVLSLPLTGLPTVSSTLKLLLSSRNERLNVAPTAGESITVDLADFSGTTSDPYLEILGGTSWDFIGRGTSVEATATSHILTEPAGVAAGDLLVACISSRIASTTQITLPSGWTRVQQILVNNVSATVGSAQSAGMMAYIVRGGSAPALTFTHPVAPSVALGRIVAYRNVNQTTPFDIAQAQMTPTATVTVSVTGLTTRADDDLVVTLCSGGQESTWSAFAATDPATSSGTTADSVLDPIWGQWLERSDIATTTGSDTSLAIYDAIKQGTGATGNFTATATLASYQTVVAGAFYLAPSGTTYNETVAETAAAAETLAVLEESKVRETEAADWRETEAGAIRITEGVFVIPPIEAAVAESSSAAETVNAAVAYTKAIAETATAADTASTTLTRSGVVTETATAVETVSGLLASTNAIAETANAIETLTASVVSAPGVFDETVIATAAAVDTVSKTLTLTGALAENAGAIETIGNTMLRAGALAESAAAVDTSTGLLARIGAIAETASAAETTGAAIIPATAGLMVVETASVVDTTAASAILGRAIVETASAAETIGKTLSLTSAVAETAAAADTVGGLLAGVGTIAESTSVGRLTETGDWRETEAGVPRGTASTIETVGGVLISTAAVVETASAAETITYSLTGAAGTTYNEAQAEVAAAVETVTGRLTAIGTVAEAASAFETTTWAVSYTRAIAETAAATETIGKTVSYTRAVVESAAVAETIGASVIPAAGVFNETVAETAAAVETIDATVIPAAQIIDVTVAESASAADTLTVQIRRWTKEPPPWADWVEEVTAAAEWVKTVPASGSSWTREDAETGDWLLEIRPVNLWTKE